MWLIGLIRRCLFSERLLGGKSLGRGKEGLRKGGEGRSESIIAGEENGLEIRKMTS